MKAWILLSSAQSPRSRRPPKWLQRNATLLLSVAPWKKRRRAGHRKLQWRRHVSRNCGNCKGSARVLSTLCVRGSRPWSRPFRSLRTWGRSFAQWRGLFRPRWRLLLPQRWGLSKRPWSEKLDPRLSRSWKNLRAPRLLTWIRALQERNGASKQIFPQEPRGS